MASSATIENDGEMLKRIIVLLLALAGLAEGAARRSSPVRLIVLGILRRAEPLGRRFVVREASYLGAAPWLMSSAEAHDGNTPADAVSLALCFRLFATALTNLSALAQRSGYRIVGALELDRLHIMREVDSHLVRCLSLCASENPRRDSS